MVYKFNKQVPVKLKGHLDRGDLEGDIDSVIERLIEFRKENPEPTIKFEIEYVNCGWDNGVFLRIYSYIQETDEERDARIKEEKKFERETVKLNKKKREEADRKEYDRLKAKFERNT